jgi:mono/diheme cytochrome c family protein
MRALIMTVTTALGVLAALPAAAQDADAGRQLYIDFCAVCHGETGRGDGVMAEVLTIAPTDLTTLSASGAFPTQRVAEQIDGRRQLAAHGGDMPIFGRWFEGDGADVALPGRGGQPILMSRPIADLITYLQEIQS